MYISMHDTSSWVLCSDRDSNSDPNLERVVHYPWTIGPCNFLPLHLHKIGKLLDIIYGGLKAALGFSSVIKTAKSGIVIQFH